MNGAEILTKFTADPSEVTKATKEIDKDFDALAAAGVLAFSKIGYEFNNMIMNILKGGIEYNSQIETYMTRLETLTGSAEEANKVLDQIKKDALSTPFDVSSLTQAESLLLSTGLSAEEARGDILALGDAVAASGGGNAELQRMAVNLQQIKNVGKASALDIKQFAYAGIDIYGLLADSMGITREEASKLDVSYEMLSKALNKASGEGGKYYKAMEKQSKTMAGATSNLQESWSVLKGELAEGVFNALKDLIPKLTELFDWLGKNKELVIAIAIPIITFTNILLGLMVVKGIALSFVKLWAAISLNPIVPVIALIAGLVAAFIYLWNNCEAFRNFWITLWEALKEAINTTVGGIKDIFNDLGTAFNWLGNKFNDIKNYIVGAATSLRDSVNDRIQGISTFFTNIGEGIKNSFKAIINWLIDKFNWFIRQVNKIKFPDWDFLGDLAGKGFNFKELQRLATGTNYVPQDMPAFLHEGEAVVPKKFNPYANGIDFTGIGSTGQQKNIIINIENNMEYDNLGQLVNNIKTFSGGAKNDFNYGMGR